MRNKIFILLVFLLFQLGWGQNQTTSFQLPQLSSDSWKQDFQFFYEQLQNFHPNPYFKVDSVEFIKKYLTVMESIDKRTNGQNLIELYKLIALIEDGHSNIRFYGNNFKVSLPLLDTFLFDDGVFIIRAQNEDLIGKQIISINGYAVESIVELISPILAADNYMHKKGLLARYLLMPQILETIGAHSKSDSLTLKLEEGAGNREIIVVPTKPLQEYFSWLHHFEPQKESPLNRSINPYNRNDTLKYWSRLLPKSGLLYMRYNEVLNRKDLPMKEFSQNLLKNFSSIDKFVIDLRECPGGNKSTWISLFNVIKNSPIDQPGKLFVITGRRTNSAATSLITKLKAATNAITVGEGIGGAPLFYSDIKEVTLPNSNVIVQISTRYNLDSYFLDPRGIHEPDFKIPNLSKDYFQYEDKALEFIKNFVAMPVFNFLPHSLTGTYISESGERVRIFNDSISGLIEFKDKISLRLREEGIDQFVPVNGYDLKVGYNDGRGPVLTLFGNEVNLVNGENIWTYKELLDKGEISAAFQILDSLSQEYPNVHIIDESVLNRYGYNYLRKGEFEKAILLFRKNVEIWPKSYNVYDSLGEAYMEKGDIENAYKNYKKSLTINPIVKWVRQL